MSWSTYTTIGTVICIIIWIKDIIKQSKTSNSSLERAKREYGKIELPLILVSVFLILTFCRIYFWPVYIAKAVWKGDL